MCCHLAFSLVSQPDSKKCWAMLESRFFQDPSCENCIVKNHALCRQDSEGYDPLVNMEHDVACHQQMSITMLCHTFVHRLTERHLWVTVTVWQTPVTKKPQTERSRLGMKGRIPHPLELKNTRKDPVPWHHMYTGQAMKLPNKSVSEKNAIRTRQNQQILCDVIEYSLHIYITEYSFHYTYYTTSSYKHSSKHWTGKQHSSATQISGLAFHFFFTDHLAVV